jgi:putative transposase
MPKGLKRHYGFKHLHFITCSCYRRLPLLGRARARNIFVKILGEVRDRFGFLLVGYVVMPEHIHLLISEPARGTPSTVMQVLKQRVSRRLRRKHRRVTPAQLGFRFYRGGKTLPQFWQRRFYDFNVWSARKQSEKLEYMHANPVKRRLVRHPRDWPRSSYSFYAQQEPVLVRIDPTC